jgi:hypothetical protein
MDPNDIGQFEALLSAYSGLSLKFHTDIYHAFAGITRYFKIDLEANLYHGIPDRFFDWFLLWKPQDAQTRRDYAPSWSWSGWDGASRSGFSEWYKRDLEHIRRAQRKLSGIRGMHTIPKNALEFCRPRQIQPRRLEAREIFMAVMSMIAFHSIVG